MIAANLYKTYNRIIKTFIVVAAAFFLYNQLFIKNTLNELLNSLTDLVSEQSFLYYLIPVIILMPLNWLLESLKWRTIVATKEQISIATALKAVFAGATISAISINRTGEFLGRIFVLKKHSFWEGAVVTLVGSYAQTWNTFFWGILSLTVLSLPFLHLLNTVNQLLFMSGIFLLWVAIVIALFLYFRIYWTNRLISPRFEKIRKAVDILSLVDNRILLKVLIFSSLRYIVFSLQFYILMVGTHIEISIGKGLMLIALMYLFNTIRPSVALLEIGLRSASAFLIFEFYYVSMLGQPDYPQAEIAAVTGFIWLINIVLPSIIGMAYIKDLRFFKKSNNL